MHDRYKALADGIVQQACEDFVDCHLKLLGVKRKKEQDESGKEIYIYKEIKQPCDEKKRASKRMIIDCVSFFRSKWFEYLKPNMDGEKLIMTLTKHVQNVVKDFEKQKAMKKKKPDKVSVLWYSIEPKDALVDYRVR